MIGVGQLAERLTRLDIKAMKLGKILVLVTLSSAICLIKIGTAEASCKCAEELLQEGTLVKITQLNETKPTATSNGTHVVLHLLLTIKTTEESISLTWTSEHNGYMVERDGNMRPIPIEFKEETALDSTASKILQTTPSLFLKKKNFTS